MLTLIVRSDGDPAALVETLAPFVEGVVKGVIGRLFVIAPGMAEAPADLARIVQEAGADLILSRNWQAGLSEAAERARTARLCVVDAGIIPGEGFFPALDRFLHMAAVRPDAVAATRLRSLTGRLTTNLLGRTSREQIVILPSAEAEKGAWDRSFSRRPTLLDCVSYRIA